MNAALYTAAGVDAALYTAVGVGAALYAAVGVGAALHSVFCVGTALLSCCLTDDALCLAVSVKADINTAYSRGTAAIFLSPYILDVSSVLVQPHALPLIFPKWFL